MQVYNWLNNAQFRCLPPDCVLCGRAAGTGQELCPDCRADLPWQIKGCAHCALSLPEHAGAALCSDCQRKPAPFHSSHSAFLYAAPVDQLIAGLKFRRQLPLGRLLGSLFAQSLADSAPRPDFILPVPLHRQRLRARGFNQAEELATAIGQVTGIAVRPAAAARIRATAVQSDLPANKRRANVRSAFQADRKLLHGRHVALVDDVVTTGSTVRSLAAAALEAGAARVDLWCIARA